MTGYCGSMSNGEPDIPLLTKQFDSYMADPVVKVLSLLTKGQGEMLLQS